MSQIFETGAQPHRNVLVDFPLLGETTNGKTPRVGATLLDAKRNNSPTINFRK